MILQSRFKADEGEIPLLEKITGWKNSIAFLLVVLRARRPEEGDYGKSRAQKPSGIGKESHREHEGRSSKFY